MRIAYGFYTADSGEILVDGQVREIATPHDAIALGIGMVHQHFMLVEPMTVAENIVLGAEPGSAGARSRKAAAEIRRLSEEFKLAVDPDAIVEALSVGQQQRVELLKALYRHARLLILDEPTAVLTPQEVEEFFAILRGMREQGKTVVIITHKLSEVLAISDEVTVMRDGHVVGRVQTERHERRRTGALDGRPRSAAAGREAGRRSRARPKLDRSQSVGDGTRTAPRAWTMSRLKFAPARSSASPASKATARRN